MKKFSIPGILFIAFHGSLCLKQAGEGEQCTSPELFKLPVPDIVKENFKICNVGLNCKCSKEYNGSVTTTTCKCE